MEEIITNEELAYRAGFMDGKYHILEQLLSNNDNMIMKHNLEDGWYAWGYEDAMNYYLQQYAQNKFIKEKTITTKFAKQIMKQFYIKRVTEYNVQNNAEISISKFRI